MNTPNLPAERLKSVGPVLRTGKTIGMYSICSSHRIVLEAAFEQAKQDGSGLLVESTCNQVNQSGGYSGMTPADFTEYLHTMARRMEFDPDRLLIGGDHLGPYPWRSEPAEKAMEKAKILVSGCVAAGYGKIHLDASMPLGDDSTETISPKLSAQRAAGLCLAAEKAAEQRPDNMEPPVYVIGAEVPTPGGSTAGEKNVPVSDPRQVDEFIKICRNEFSSSGLDRAWDRVIAVVVQPGVDFGETWVADYNRRAAQDLSGFHAELAGSMTYEIHATDYQSPQALKQMAEDGFSLMKTGPCLTHAFREAVFALAHIEELLFAGSKAAELSRIREILTDAMDRNPAHWNSHHLAGSSADWTVLFSYLDRVRYYWARTEIERALARLAGNLSAGIPEPLISQYLPCQHRDIREGRLSALPFHLVRHKIRCALTPYSAACRMAEEI